MEIKDIFGISISSAALCFSIYATIYSNRKAKENKQRTVRELFTNILDKLVSLQLDTIKIKNEHQHDAKFIYDLNGLIRQKQGFLLEEATYLARQIPKLIQSYEYNTLATNHGDIGNKEEAEEFYKLAIDKSKHDRERGITTSSYAVLLFQTDRQPEARDTFKKSIDLITLNDDISKQIRGNIYRMWATSEFDFAQSTSLANNILIKAANEYSAINIDSVKKERLVSLAALHQIINASS